MTDTPDLTDQLEEVIAEAAANHGTHDHHGQAADVLDWLSKRDPSPWLQIVNDRIVVHWPDGAAPAVLVAREAVEGWAAQVNQLRDERDQMQRQLLQGGACCVHDPAEHDDDGCTVAWQHSAAGIAIIGGGCQCKRKGVAL